MNGPARTHRSVIVEFTGLTGVGKSTLASLVVRDLHARGVSMTRLPRRSALAKQVMMGRAAYAWLRTCAWLGPRRLLRARRDRFPRRLWRYLKRMERFRRHDGVRIVDGGMTRLLMTLHMTGALDDLLAAWQGLAAICPMPDLIVLIDADDEDIAHRRGARATGNDLRVPRPTPAERDALRLLRTILEGADAAGEAPRFVVGWSGQGNQERLAAAIADAIIGDGSAG